MVTKVNDATQWVMNRHRVDEVGENGPAAMLHPRVIRSARQLVKSIDNYEPTPLVKLEKLAYYLGLDRVYVKNESKRFGLNSFKVLGGIYAVANVICQKLGVKVQDMTYQQLISKDVKDSVGDLLFVTATDGNHGRGIAWAARQLGQKSVVFMPKGSSAHRLKMVQDEGAEASITELNYDDAVRHANEYAQVHGGIMVQDTVWEGYEEIPVWIMQGYAVLMDEVKETLEANNELPPTHVFLQAGVGTFAGGIQGYLAQAWKENRPKTVVLEPTQADCYYRTAVIDDGKPHAVTGHMETIMAGLACGEPNEIGWKILRTYASAFVSCPDELTARGMRILAAPLQGDQQVVSGESGAIGVGFLAELMTNETLKSLQNQLGVNQESRILIISTEGDTDPEQYRNIVWEGAYPS